MIICTVGRTKCGKTEVAKMIQKYTNFPIVEVSSIVKQFAGDKVDRKELQLEKNKHKENPDWLYNKVKGRVTSNCIVSGIREMYLLNKLRKDFEKVIVVAIKVGEKERKRRYLFSSNKTEQEFAEDESRDAVLFDIEDLIKEAQFSVNTELSLVETERRIAELIKTQDNMIIDKRR